jgi:hypothetical protein
MQSNHMQYKNFVPASKPVELYDVSITKAQRAEIKARLAAVWPEIDGCQIVTSGGRFRLLAVRGATIPADCTDVYVLSVVQMVQARTAALILTPDKVVA